MKYVEIFIECFGTYFYLILLLRFLEYDINEISLELNMTPNAVRKRINKFKKIII